MESQKKLMPTGKNSGKKYVCISYSSSDSDMVFNKCVFPIMTNYGLKVYWDEDFKNNATKSWSPQMLDSIEMSEAVILFVSNNYIESYACFLEALFSYVYEKKVIIIKLDWNLVLSDNTQERKISESTIAEFSNLLVEFDRKEVRERLPSGFYRFVNNLVANRTTSQNEISQRFKDLLGKFEVTQLDINDVSKSLTSLVKSIQNVSKDVFDSATESNSEAYMKSGSKSKGEVQVKPKTEKKKNTGIIPELKISCDVSIGGIRNAFSNPDTVKRFKQVRENMPWGGKGCMDYVMASLLSGCNNVKENSPEYQINYYLYAVASDGAKEKGLGATWTWSSNCRKVLGLEKSGTIPDSYDTYFKKLPEDTTLEEIGELFMREEDEQFKTTRKDNVIIALNSLADFMISIN